MPLYRCPAKVNLALSVGSPIQGGPQHGYHPICSWMVQVTLFDDLLVERLAPSPAIAVEGWGEGASNHPASVFSIEWAGDAPTPSPIDWPLEKDLIVKAHRALEAHTGRALPVRVTLRKRIPVGAGLAGGSTDGAMMLRALDEMFGLHLPRQTMAAIASKLGSDLPFFLYHNSAVVSGVGEIVEPSTLPGVINLTLILANLHCNTAAVYRKFDEVVKAHAVETDRVHALARGSFLPGDGPFNDLAEPAFHVEPRLRQLRETLVHKFGRPVHVTGSGAAMFVVARDGDDARRLEHEIRAMNVPAMAVQTIE